MATDRPKDLNDPNWTPNDSLNAAHDAAENIAKHLPIIDKGLQRAKDKVPNIGERQKDIDKAKKSEPLQELANVAQDALDILKKHDIRPVPKQLDTKKTTKLSSAELSSLGTGFEEYFSLVDELQLLVD